MAIPRWVYHFRGILVSPPLIFAGLCFRFEVENDPLIWPLGLGIFFTGVALRIWAQQHLHRRLGVSMQLCISGPYQFVRNPLYIANILICIGLTIVSELLWMVPVAVLWAATVYSLVARHEEARLLKRYGQPYRMYMSGVPRWFPRALQLRNLSFVNEYFFASIVAEVHSLLLLLPYIVKEAASVWIVR